MVRTSRNLRIQWMEWLVRVVRMERRVWNKRILRTEWNLGLVRMVWMDWYERMVGLVRRIRHLRILRAERNIWLVWMERLEWTFGFL